MLKTIAISLALAVAAAAPLTAQGQGTKAGKIPPGQRPPAGMCRIWLNGVPPGQQPAPTDCATAVRNRPANGRVIFGDDYVDGRGKKLTGSDDERRTAPREERDRQVDRSAPRRGDNDADRQDADRGARKPKRGDDDANRANRKARPRDSARADGKP